VFAKIFESLYLKVLVNIVVERAKTLVYIEMCSKKGVVSSVQEEFNTTNLSPKMYEFITAYTKESPYFYISILDMSPYQGAIPSCLKNRLEYYTDLSTSEYKCYDKKWTYYTSKSDIYEIENKYEKIGIDYIFSPFSLLNHFFIDKIVNNLAMYILVQDSFLSLAIFEKSQLVYAHHLDMMTKDDVDDILLSEDINDEDLLLSTDNAIELDDIELPSEESDELDNFGNIEDLDAIEEIDEFSENKDIEEELLESDIDVVPANESQFNEDYQRFTLIQSAVGHFYKDAKYESRFIENVYIADGVGVTSDLKKYLEEEMFFNVYVRHIEIDTEVCELAKAELGI
jgi:hypothetical protein